MGSNGVSCMKVVFIRHGEPRYDEVIERRYPHQGYDLGKLTESGVNQATEVSKDNRLKGATLIISSPYTRALQTAAIISRLTDIPLTVENDFHEWMPDVTFTPGLDLSVSYDDYIKHKGMNVSHKLTNWETYEELKKRTHNALKKYYPKYDKIIVVCHAIVMSTFTHFNDQIEFCGIREIDVNDSFF